MNKIIILQVLIFMFVFLFAAIAKDENRKMKYDMYRNDLKINGIKASNIASYAYDEKMDGMISATDGLRYSVITLGYNIPEFATINDKVWRVVIKDHYPGGRIFCGTFFVHSETGKVYFLNGLWDRDDIYATRDWKRKGLFIKNTRSTDEKALQLAKKSYHQKMHLKKTNDEQFKIDKIRIGWKIPGFVEATDEVWEATVTSKEGKYMGCIWIHPVTENVVYVTGAWDSENRGK